MQADVGYKQMSLTEAGLVSQSPRNAFLSRLDCFTPDLLEDAQYGMVSLFCGGGGLDLGLGFAGFKSLVVSDVAPVFVETVTRNIPRAKGLVYDAMRLTKEMIYELSGTENIDLVAAGPPCQAFSILGRRNALDDPRGKLALKYFDLVVAMQPKAFLFENVPGLLTVNKGEDWKQLYQYAEDATGYHLHFRKLNSVAFGIPQFRERVVLIGFRKDVPFEFPESATGRFVERLISEGHLLTPSKWALEEVNGLPNHDIRNHGEAVRNRYNKIQPGERDRIDHTDRIDPHRPSGTVLVGSSEGGGRPHIHPYSPRVITVREAARLQSFPDWYEFYGTSTAQYRQVGNAVPPLMAYEIGRKIAEALEKY